MAFLKLKSLRNLNLFAQILKVIQQQTQSMSLRQGYLTFQKALRINIFGKMARKEMIQHHLYHSSFGAKINLVTL